MISVVLPVYNAEKYISRSIQSILSQTFEKFELIIVNDGSTDSTLDIIKSFNDDRIKLVNLKDNQGLISALNIGISYSECKYIARMDADDVCFPTRFEKQLMFLEEHDDYVACGTCIINVNNRSESYMRYPESDNEIRVALTFFERNICHPTVMIRRSAIVDNDIQYREDYKYAEDYTLWIDLARVGKLHNLKEALLYYQRHESQVSSAYYSDQIEISRRIVREQLKDVFPSLSDNEIKKIKRLCVHEQGVYPETKLSLSEIKWLIKKIERLNAATGVFQSSYLKKLLFFKRFRCSFYYVYRFNYLVKLRCFWGYFKQQPVRASSEIRSLIWLLVMRKNKI